ncbi:MAG: ATP-binding cassette domain-containing protein [Thermoguttaceae bacterium]
MKQRSTLPAIETQDVSFAYPGGIEALADVTFRAWTGELVAVMGANGSGKTTLMKILMRLLSPRQGQVRLAAADIAGLRAADLYRRIGMVFQNPVDQLFAPSVGQDVAFGPRNLGLAESEVAQRVDEALAAVDALALHDRPIHQLSFGQQKRVCLAGVLAMRPGILVLDEPTAGLDPVSEAEMIGLLLRLNRREHITIILSTHCVDLLPVLAHRIYVLREGRVRHEGPTHEVLTNAGLLAQCGLRLPLVAQLFHQLGDAHGLAADPLPLSVEQARRQILDWLNGGVCGAPRPGEQQA